MIAHIKKILALAALGVFIAVPVIAVLLLCLAAIVGMIAAAFHFGFWWGVAAIIGAVWLIAFNLFLAEVNQ